MFEEGLLDVISTMWTLHIGSFGLRQAEAHPSMNPGLTVLQLAVKIPWESKHA